MNTKKFLNDCKNKKSPVILFVISILILFFATGPAWLSLFHVCEYLNLKNGNIQREYSVLNITYYKSEKKSALSSAMHFYSDTLPDNRLLIRKRTGLRRYQLKSAKCYTELVELILNHKINSANLSRDEIRSIVNKYQDGFLPTCDK